MIVTLFTDRPQEVADALKARGAELHRAARRRSNGGPNFAIVRRSLRAEADRMFEYGKAIERQARS